VQTRLLHLSDLHVGAREEQEVEGPLRALIEAARPELVVATGDLTHRGRRGQHERAAAFLRGLGLNVLAIPGNHDIPGLGVARFARPFAEFERAWGATEPVFSSPSLHVVGLNSVRPWRYQSGGLRNSQLARARELLAGAADGALRVVALHHHLVGAPWRARNKRPVSRRNHVLAELVESGAELILAGHIHQSAVSERREFSVSSGGERGVTVSVAPGLGQPRPHRLGEARGLHLYEADDPEIRVDTYVWREGAWGLTASRRFPRGTAPLPAQNGPRAS
jgi:3',5'-cyclic AMP phosphodiesterase CpdA